MYATFLFYLISGGAFSLEYAGELIMLDRTFQTLAILTALVGGTAPAAFADGVGVVAEGSDQVTILQQSGFDPDQGSGDAATQISTALGVEPNYWSGTEAFNEQGNFEEWVHVVVVPAGHPSLGAAAQAVTAPQPAVTPPVATATAPASSGAPVANVPSEHASLLSASPTATNTNAVYLRGTLVGYSAPDAGDVRAMLGGTNYSGEAATADEQQAGIWWKHYVD